MSDTDSGMDLEALRDGVRGVLSGQASHERVMTFTDTGDVLDQALWAQASALGWTALSAPEDLGGLGLGLAELAVVYEELGRAVTPLPILGTMLVIAGLSLGGNAEQKAAWMPRLAAGKNAGAVSMLMPGRLAVSLTITRDSDGGVVLDGVADDLLDGAAVGVLLLLAREDDVLRWVLVEPAVDGVTVETIVTVDRTRHLGRALFAEVRVPDNRILPGNSQAVAEAVLIHASLALACDAIGGAETIFEITLDYLKTRQQFGKPIGSFQALKHRCAEHKIALVAARELVAEAVARAVAGDPEALRYGLTAKALATSVSFRIAEDAVQLHGGIGYTWEHPCHLYLKRARLNEQLFGDEAAHLDQVAKLLLAAA